MNLDNPIGGYFGLELSKGAKFPYSNAILLNNGRNCLAYILEKQKVDRVYMPKFTCDVMFEPLKDRGIEYTLYDIDENLEIKADIELKQNELIVYTNYFGVKNDYSRKISKKYKDQLVLDCSQAFYFEPLTEGHTFYSPRKFFGLPDGGCLITPLDRDPNLLASSSYEHFSHLIKRIDLGAEAGYEDFKRNDDSLSGMPVKLMSKLTQQILNSIDYEDARSKRDRNFMILHDQLSATNKLHINISDTSGPMVYPYLLEGGDSGLRSKLIDNKIFVATYWPNVIDSCDEESLEYYLAKNILPIPIDQRYDDQDMLRILEAIHE